MRIGLVSPYPWDIPGGVVAHVRDLAEELMSQGHQVSVLSPVEGDGGGLPGWVVDAGHPVPIPYNGSVPRLLLGPVSYARTRRWVRDGVAGGAFDVLHVHEPTAPSVAILACYAARGPIVATFHTSNTRSKLLVLFEPLLTPGLEKLNARIAVSPAARRTIVEHLGGDCVEIPNGVAVARYADAEPWPEHAGSPVVAFVGRIDEPRKGLATLLEAWPDVAVPGARLLVAGPGDPPATLPEGVALLGQVTEEDKARLYRTATVYCAPNLGGESFGIVLLEAMAAGTPVLASDLEPFRRVLQDGLAGELFPPGDTVALASKLTALLGGEGGARRDELIVAGRTLVADYDWPVVAGEVLSVYETVIEGAELIGLDVAGLERATAAMGG